MNVRNFEHNSGKDKKGKGRCKGRVRASKASLRAIKEKYKGGRGSSLSCVVL